GGADEAANEALDLLAGLGIDRFEGFVGERALAGLFVNLFAGQALVVFAGDFPETHAGDVDRLFDGMAAVDFDGDARGTGDRDFVDSQDVPHANRIGIEPREVDTVDVAYGGLDAGGGLPAPAFVVHLGADGRVDHHGDQFQRAGRFDDFGQRAELPFVVELAGDAVGRRENGPLLRVQEH